MIDGLDKEYRLIAESMMSAIPEDWSSAKFEVIFYPNSSTYEAEYVRTRDGQARGFRPESAGARTFRQIRKLFKDGGQPVWGQAVFELFPDGRFNMKWGYDNCDDNGDTVFDADKEFERAELRHRRLTS